MKVAIVDTQTTGHHFEYIYGLCSEINKRNVGKQINIYCDSDIYEYIDENNLPAIDKNNNLELKCGLLNQPSGNWFQKIRVAYRNIRKLSEYDQIIFLTLNIYFPVLLFYSFFNKPSFSFSGIFFNPHPRKEKALKNWIRNFTIRRVVKNFDCQIFILNDQEAVDILNKKYATDAFKMLEDPIPEFYYQNLEGDKLNNDNTPIFSLIGSISKRKGIFEFLEAIKLSDSKGKFLIVGKVDKKIIRGVKRKINELRQRDIDIKLVNKFLTNEEFAKYISITDVIVVPYLSKGSSSGILGHAAYTDKVVIGPDKGLLSEIIKKYSLGITINPKDRNEFAKYISDPHKIYSNSNSTGKQKYVEKNSISKFASSLLEV